MDASLGDGVLAAYRATFARAVAAGRVGPLLIPYSLLGAFFVPVLWLAVPHVRRPLLYRSRWLVAAFCIVFNLHVARTTSSANMAVAYAAGLTAAWGTISSMHLIVWARPQFDAARAVRRPRGQAAKPGLASVPSDSAPGGRGLRRRKGSPEQQPATDAEGDFVWQPFPADAPFIDRLGWVLDLTCSFRGAGWNWSITSIPRPRMPSLTRLDGPVDLESVPIETRSGFKRCLTEGDLLRARFRSLVTMYLTLDLCSVYMTKDPFFVLGPDYIYSQDLPPHLRAIPAWLLLAHREIVSAAGILCAIHAVFCLQDVVQYWLLKAWFPSRSALWFHSSTFGSFSTVLERGLSGLWGAWWHQTFRHQFLAPATYLVSHGYITKGSQAADIANIFVSFFQSGLLHSFGSITSVPKTKPWRAMVFFLLQALGILIQRALLGQKERGILSIPKSATKAANLLFAAAWLYFTGPFIIDDFASAGLWLTEPVPISPLRLMGLGHETDHWWRWGSVELPTWHRGEHWWKSGIAL